MFGRWILGLCLGCAALFAPLSAEKVAVVTMAIGEQYMDATHLGVVTKQEYCEKHGYDFYLFTESLDPARPIPWSKIPAIQQVLADYDWVFWTDADSLITNSNIRLEEFFDENYIVILCRDPLGINTGEFLIRNCPTSFEFLSLAYAKTHLIHRDLWEQVAIQELLAQRSDLRSQVKILPQRNFNSFAREFWPVYFPNFPAAQYWEEGDFIVHFAGCRSLPWLKELMTLYFSRRS